METSAKSGQNVEQVSDGGTQFWKQTGGASFTDLTFVSRREDYSFICFSLFIFLLQAFIQLAKDIKSKMDKKNVSVYQ